METRRRQKTISRNWQTASWLTVVLLLCGCSADTEWFDRDSLSNLVDQVHHERLAERQHRESARRTQGHVSAIPNAPDRSLWNQPEWTAYPMLVSDMQGASEQAGPAAKTETSAEDLAPLSGLCDTMLRDLKHMPRELWTDTKAVYLNKTNAIILLAAGGAALGLRCDCDDEVEDKFDRARTCNPEWGDVGGAIGNPVTHFALAGAWYVAGTLEQDTRTYQVGKTLFSALIINSLSTLTLKAAACTDSPNGESLAWPSGHTSSAFCFASVMHRAYGPWVGIPLYGLAGYGAFSRLDDREHHLSDVVFGAALGLVVGHTVAAGHEPEILGGKILPYADPVNGSAGLVWAKSF
jgi:hypothetical protein